VGEEIRLNCVLDPPLATLSNFQWTVPGNTFSNYTHNDQFAVLDKEFPLTNDAVYYYWADGTNLAPVTCSAMVCGQWLSARSFFQVKRPSASLTAAISSSVALDTNFRFPGYNLHFGNDTPGYHGIDFSFTYEDTALPAACWFFVQVGDSVLRQHLVIGGTPSWWRAAGQGLDDEDPYGVAGTSQSTYDSPGFRVLDGAFEVEGNDNYSMYLMFTPPLLSGKAVPIQKAGWGWSGYGTNSGTWQLVSGDAYLSGPTPTNAVAHPEWSQRIQDTGQEWVPEERAIPIPCFTGLRS
jgi:hypothetical protein